MSVVLCLINSGHSLQQSGNLDYTNASNFSLQSMSTLYQNFGFPACKQFMEQRSMSSLCQPNIVFQEPMYTYGVFTPEIFCSPSPCLMKNYLFKNEILIRKHASYFKIESISAKFQGWLGSNNDPETSAPYTGALCLRVFQN